MSKRSTILRSVLAMGVVAAAHAAGPVPVATSVPFGANGDAVDGTSGQPLALTPTSLLVAAEGPDGSAGTADDVTLLVTGLGGTAVVTAIATPHASTDSSRIERLSATRAALVSSGPDGRYATADDELLVLDRLGSEDRVIPVTIGGLGNSQQFTPERLASDVVVVPSFGTDLLPDTADDEVVVVSTATEPPAVQRFAAPFQRSGGRTRIVAASPGTFFVASDGPDRKSSNADDVVYLFRAAAGSFVRTDLAARGLNRRAAGRSVRLHSAAALVVSAGADALDSTLDDEVLLLDAAAGAVTHIAVPYAKSGSAGRPTVLSRDLAVVATFGGDGVEGTADDAVAVLGRLGEANTVTSVVVGPTGDNNECRPVALDGSTFALVTFGGDQKVGTADDEITIVHSVGGVPLVQHVVVGAVAGGSTSAVVPASPGALLVAGGGPDQAIGTSDDAVVVLTGIGGPLAVASVPIGGALDSIDAFRFVPELLGGGRAALLSSGTDDDLGSGGDDAVRVISGLGVGPALDVERLTVQFAGKRPSRPARVSLKATLTLDAPESMTSEDVTLSIGNASQTIPAGSIVSSHGGRSLRYSDPQGTLGLVRAFTFDVARRTLTVDARGADRDIATTSPGYVPIGLEIGSTLVPQSLTAKPGRRGFVFRKKP